jgi:hypothetical protein
MTTAKVGCGPARAQRRRAARLGVVGEAGLRGNAEEHVRREQSAEEGGCFELWRALGRRATRGARRAARRRERTRRGERGRARSSAPQSARSPGVRLGQRLRGNSARWRPRSMCWAILTSLPEDVRCQCARHRQQQPDGAHRAYPQHPHPPSNLRARRGQGGGKGRKIVCVRREVDGGRRRWTRTADCAQDAQDRR